MIFVNKYSKKYKKLITMFFVCMMLASKLEANDSYNFYFQKDQAGPILSPRDQQMPVANPSLDSSISEKKSDETNIEVPQHNSSQNLTIEVEDFSKWQLSLFFIPGGWVDSYGASIQYNVSKYFGVNFDLAITAYEFDYSDNVHRTSIAAGVVFTPAHISFFGKQFVDLSLTAGITNMRNSQLRPYAGPLITFNTPLPVFIEGRVVFNDRGYKDVVPKAGISVKF